MGFVECEAINTADAKCLPEARLQGHACWYSLLPNQNNPGVMIILKTLMAWQMDVWTIYNKLLKGSWFNSSSELNVQVQGVNLSWEYCNKNENYK